MKPIPPKQATASSIFHVAPSGMTAIFDLTANQLAAKMPNGLPTSSPKKTPMPTEPIAGEKWKMLMYSSEVISTPALARAKIGMMRNVT